MSDTLLFPTEQSTQDSANGSLVHIDSKVTQDHALVAGSDKTTEIQKITALKSGNDWYQNDLSHMTTNLMRQETALSTTISSSSLSENTNLSQYSYAQSMSRSISIGGNGVIIGGTSFTITGDGTPVRYDPTNPFNALHPNIPSDKLDTYAIVNRKAQVDGIYMRMLGRHPDQKALSFELAVMYKGYQSVADRQDQMAHSDEIKINIKAIGKSVLGYEPNEKQIASVQKELSGYAASRDDIAKIFQGKPIENKTYLDKTKMPVLIANSEINTNSLA